MDERMWESEIIPTSCHHLCTLSGGEYGLGEHGGQMQQPHQFTFYCTHVNFLQTIRHV